MRLRHARCLFAPLLIGILTAGVGHTQDRWPDVLEKTAPLRLEEPLDVRMVRGISRFAEEELAGSPRRREASWPGERPGSGSFDRWAATRRERLQTIIGAVDERRPPLLSTLTESLPRGVGGSAERPLVRPVRWDVLEGVCAEGLLLVPAGPVRGYAVAVPDAAWTPEMFCGLEDGVEEASQLPRRLVRQGVVVLVPTLISRDDEFSGHPDIRFTNIPHRELVYRMSFELGRHIIGFEVQKVLAAVDVLEDWSEDADVPIGVCGVGDGGQLALYTAALDPRIGSALVCGYFQQREQVWREPIDRNVWSQLTDLGDAEIAALVTGELSIEACSIAGFGGPKPARAGRPDFAAPGTINSADPASVRAEFSRLAQITGAEHAALFESGGGAGPAGASDAFTHFANRIVSGTTTPDSAGDRSSSQLQVVGELADPTTREERQLQELVRLVQRLLHRSDKVRARVWSGADASSIEAWQASTQSYRDRVHREMIGRLDQPPVDPAPRTRKVIDEPTHVGYEVLLDVAVADGEGDVIAGGILLLPRDLKQDEKRPVVVCQHGLEGTPMDTITTDDSTRAWGAYKGFSTRLAERGFIVYAPQNPYRGQHDFRVIQRKSNPLQRSLFSYIIEQHRQTLRWLATQPWVDAERIAFYGLSYGGKTAVRVPPLLEPEGESSTPRYCLSICSADFNEWIRKNVSSEDRYSYVYTREYEMFEWNMGHLAGYAELASLMIPRPFMVERGHDDGVAPDEWVAWEYAKVRRLYDKLGIGERIEMEVFDGPHTIHGVGTFAFLERHLNWTPRAPDR